MSVFGRQYKFPWNLLFIDLFIPDNFHILYHNVINMSAGNADFLKRQDKCWCFLVAINLHISIPTHLSGDKGQGPTDATVVNWPTD